MRINAVNQLPHINYTGDKNKKDDKCKSNVGKVAGFVIGASLGTALITTQIKLLKTPKGKRNIIEGLNAKDRCLNDIEKRIPKLDAEGKIIKPEGNVSERTRKVVADFRNSLFVWGTTITAITTFIGALADRSISEVKRKEAALKESL